MLIWLYGVGLRSRNNPPNKRTLSRNRAHSIQAAQHRRNHRVRRADCVQRDPVLVDRGGRAACGVGV